MAETLSWQAEDDTLVLRGELDRVTLLQFWEQRDAALAGIRFLDVSRLERVDSAGVAMMLHLCALQTQRGGSLLLTGVTEKLRTLIALYKLHNILPCADDRPG
ncbi:lipid asymmetry maintenance protein MlaB [Sodalis sp. RH21]|uniref:lipid asymmetry maintenance protein MlaB n=1 Tax=unclassified Sodalis (in: enterobacteria) TaxID=2636512 RepID=UPI0039B62F06